MNVLIVSFLVFQAVGAFDKVLLFRSLNSNDSDIWTCTAENNGDAFTWNTYWRRANDTDFSNEYERQLAIDCWGKKCNWNIGDTWKLGSSSTMPMGLVLDSKWEGATIPQIINFREFDNFRTLDIYNNIVNVYAKGAFAFSLRGKLDCDILLCDDTLSSFCYWITIGVHKYSIRNCLSGIYNCTHSQETTVDMDKGLTPTEWRHFVLTHDVDNITLYDNENMLLTYLLPPNIKSRIETNIQIFNIFYKSLKPVFLRYHQYNFFYTYNKTFTLESPAVILRDNTFCLRLSIALCATCVIEMHLFQTSGTHHKETLVTVEGKPAIHGLPTWQSFDARMTVNRKVTQPVKIKITLKNKEFNHDNKGFWAVRDIMECPPPGTRRISTIRRIVNIASKTRQSQEEENEEITCQRISYNRNEVVGFKQPMSTFLDDYECPNGPLCSIFCNNFNEQFDKDCKNVAICDWRACTCNVGIIGERCDSYCNYNQYGYACKETCGNCMGGSCHFKTGLCPTCNHGIDVFYVPPYCKIEINRPAKPIIEEINETSVRVSVKFSNKYNTTLEYAFVKSSDNSTNCEKYRLVNPNDVILTSQFSNLIVATSYSFFCRLRIKESGFVVDGHSSEITTRCNDIPFNIKSGERNVTIMKKKIRLSYLCPLTLYRLTILQDNITVIQENILTLPYTYHEILRPGALYKVIISNYLTGKAFEFEDTTIDGVPSMVQNITSTVSDNQVELQWKPPETPNGKIVNYEINLQVLNYMGCRNNDQSYSVKNKKKSDYMYRFVEKTWIIFSKLSLYTEYKATVYAWNSNKGEGASVVFVTCGTKIPRSKYTNLKLSNQMLVWDLPEDCLTITGEINATRLIFINVNDANDIIKKQTRVRSLNVNNINLQADETYKVYAYVLRGFSEEYNSSAYAEYVFKTRPKAPPAVGQLEIFEFDTLNKLISFRWKKPYPPNGQLDSYVGYVTPLKRSIHNRKCVKKEITLSKDDYCPFWEDYNCGNIIIPCTTFGELCVYAKNQNVSGNGVSSCVSYVPWNSDPPGNVTVRMYDKHTVELSWLHPWKTGSPLKRFYIVMEVNATELSLVRKEYKHPIEYNIMINHYETRYTTHLNVLPSTLYTFFVYPINSNGDISKSGSASIMTPASIGFQPENLTYSVNSDNTVCIQVPQIVNFTKTSRIYFIVKGNNPCKDHKTLSRYLKKHASVKDNETAWLAARFLINNYTAEEFCIGDNKKSAMNCPLRKDDFYTVIVMIDVDKNSTSNEVAIKYILFGVHPKRHDEKWIIPLVILLIFIIICYSYRRSIQKVIGQYCFFQNLNIAYNCQDKRVTLHHLPRSECNSTYDVSDIASPLVKTSEDYDNLLMPIKVRDFEDYVKKAISSGSLDEQYEMLPRGLTKSCYYGQLSENKSKNRYRNLMPYDETRVVLKKLQDDPFSDYINANYITGYKKEKRYIATQGPKANTVIDFWRMVWQENALVICMLASVCENGKMKCEQYWPDIGKEKKYGDVIVLNFKQEVFADYTFRTLNVTCDDETRQVKHLHYTTWPDHGIPTYTYSVVTYLKKLLAIQIGNGPMVVHCSAGIGRTGTVILCDICLRRAAVEQVVDVLSEIRTIRNQRVNMVDNKEQYLFAHLLLIECLLALPSSLPCNETLPARINDMKNHLHVQLQRIEDTSWQDEALQQAVCQSPLSERNIAKNRYAELVSRKAKRIYLKRYSIHDEDSDYIAGVYVDGLKVQRQYLASQLPMPSTFSDFWRMITELRVELIIMLQCPDPKDPTCCPVVPTEKEFQPTPNITVTVRSVKKENYYVHYKLFLIDNSESTTKKQPITILRSTKWLPGRDKKPPTEAALVALWQAADRISRVETPTVVLCHDGVTGCGLYIALSFLLERMTIEKECDVCLAIRIVKRSRPDFVRSVEQMEYLYNAALTYVENCSIYANISKN